MSGVHSEKETFNSKLANLKTKEQDYLLRFRILCYECFKTVLCTLKILDCYLTF